MREIEWGFTLKRFETVSSGAGENARLMYVNCACFLYQGKGCKGRMGLVRVDLRAGRLSSTIIPFARTG